MNTNLKSNWALWMGLIFTLITFGRPSKGIQDFGKNKDQYKIRETRFQSNDTVHMGVVDQSPSFKACNLRYSISDKAHIKQCFDTKVKHHIATHFDYNLSEKLRLYGTNRIFVKFVIGPRGNVSKVEAKAAHPDLEEEAIRVLRLLPRAKPGKHRGALVAVSCNVLIAYEVK